MAKETYEVVGDREVFGVQPGKTVKANPDDASVRRRLASGNLRKKRSSSPKKGKGRNRSSS